MASSFPMKKNTATRIVFPILDADGDPVTGAAGLDSEYSLDGANFGDCTNEAQEIEVASGIYYLDLVLGETNGDVVAIQVKTTTEGAKTTVLVFYTSAQTLDEIDVNIDSILADTDVLEKIGTNRWKILSNQLIIYDDDGVTPLYTFDLKDSSGNPAMENVYERVPV